MEIRVKEDSVEIEGYVNAIERNSKPLMSRVGQFIERICKGAFNSALKRNDDVHILLNHDWNRDLGSTKVGNLELEEDNIGLKARAIITDKDVIEKARNNDLVGWSFGFTDRDVENGVEKGLPLREVKDLDLYEVSILDRTKTPAYDGTLVMARDENSKEINIRNELTDLELKAQLDHEDLYNKEMAEHDALDQPNQEKHSDIEKKYAEEHAKINDEIEEKRLDIIASKIAEKVVEKLKGNKEPVNEEQPIEEPAQETRAEEVVEETTTEEVPKQQEIVEKNIDYSKYDAMVKEMKEE